MQINLHIRLRALLHGKELINGGTADNTGRNEMRVAHTTQNSHWSKSMCPPIKYLIQYLFAMKYKLLVKYICNRYKDDTLSILICVHMSRLNSTPVYPLKDLGVCICAFYQPNRTQNRENKACQTKARSNII